MDGLNKKPKIDNAPKIEAPKQEPISAPNTPKIPKQEPISAPNTPNTPKIPKQDPVRQKIMDQGFAPNKNTEYVDRIRSMAIYPQIEAKYGKGALDKGMKMIGETFSTRKPFPPAFSLGQIRHDDNVHNYYRNKELPPIVHEKESDFDIFKDNNLADQVLNKFSNYYRKKGLPKDDFDSQEEYNKFWEGHDKIHNALKELLSDQEFSTLFEDELRDDLRKRLQQSATKSEKSKEYTQKKRLQNADSIIEEMIAKDPELAENKEFLKKLYLSGYLK